MSSIRIPCPQCGRELKISDRRLLGKRGKCPGCQHSFVLEEPVVVLAEATHPPVGTAARWVPDAPPTTPLPAAPSLAVPSEPILSSVAQRHRHQRQRSRWTMLVVAAVVVVAAGGLAYVGWKMTSATDRSTAQAKSPAAEPKGAMTAAADSPAELASTGEAIPLELLPAGTRLLVHLRPAEFWQPDSKGEEFRFCLGPLGEFVETQIKTLCKYPPQEIEEVQFAWIPGPRGTAPDFACVVRLKQEARKSDLLDKLGGQRVETYGRPVYVDGERAAVVVDLKTFAIGPASMAEEMVSSIGGKNPLPQSVEELIPKSDRHRHVSVLFEPTAVLLDLEFLAPPNLQPFLRGVMDWFGDDAESVLWSIHLEDERFVSEAVVRTPSGTRPAALAERLRERLDQLPKEVLHTVQRMDPKEVGKRQIIGRVPAMSKVFALATQFEHGRRDVRAVTLLPERAAPNLALGTLLTWDESTRTDFSKPAPAAAPSSDANLPKTIAERLRKKIDVDFRREPLQGAFAYIGEETKVNIEIDGDALKLAGYTKNMPQEFKLEQVPALVVIRTIFEQKDQGKMCLVIDEQKKLCLVTTHAAAEQKGLKPYPLEP
uniref:Uncharacterized protein n=1 Tax=Schlesneria paludicola TaxID=360056 RepID=A0A7C4QSK4_9PLAN